MQQEFIDKIIINLKRIIAFLVASIGFAAALSALNSNFYDSLDYILTIFLFLFGCVLVIQSERIFQIRREFEEKTIKRISENKYAQGAFRCLHRITESIRDYRTFKQQQKDHKKKLDIEEAIKTLEKICEQLINRYLKPKYGDEITVCIKYKMCDEMIAIRSGYNKDQRSPTPEPMDDCHLYKFLTQEKQDPKHFLIINDTHNEAELVENFGNTSLKKKLRHRSEIQGYKTFMALIINTGTIKTAGKLTIKDPLGFLGIDSPKVNAFADFRKYEKDFIAAIADAASELLWDIRQIEKNKVLEKS